MELVLGVLDVAYADARNGHGATTTAEVANILENRYHVMETFYYAHQDEIAEWLAGSVADAIETITKTGRNVMPTLEATQKIEAEFRAFLDREEMAKMVAGLDEAERSYFLGSTGGFTGAASAGVNHRKKHPYAKKNKPRPAFVDTGLYSQSMRAWVEGA